MQARGFHLTRQELQEEMNIIENETDPFERKAPFEDNSFEAIAITLEKSLNFWREEVEKCCSREEIQNTGFQCE